MLEPLSAGTAVTGLKMIWNGFTWLLKSRKAPWSAIPFSAEVRPHILPWYQVYFRPNNDTKHQIDFLSVRSIKPGKLPMRRSENGMNPTMVPASEADKIEKLAWTTGEAGKQQFAQYIFVNLETLHGEQAIDFELQIRLRDNQRTELPLWVRTNKLELP